MPDGSLGKGNSVIGEYTRADQYPSGAPPVIKRKQRLPMLDLAELSVEDREAVEKNSMNGKLFNIFRVLANHPKLVKRWTPFAEIGRAHV